MSNDFTTILSRWLLADPKRMKILKALSGSGTERSGAAQRCPPSTPGSPSGAPSFQKLSCGRTAPKVSKPSNFGKEGAPDVDNSVVRLPVSELAAVANGWRNLAEQCHEARKDCIRGKNVNQAKCHKSEADALEFCAEELEEIIASQRPQRSGGERRKANEKS